MKDDKMKPTRNEGHCCCCGQDGKKPEGCDGKGGCGCGCHHEEGDNIPNADDEPETTQT